MIDRISDPWGERRDWFRTFVWAALGNAIGGLGLVTTLRLVQVGRLAGSEAGGASV
jgi:hypothetical protein